MVATRVPPTPAPVIYKEGRRQGYNSQVEQSTSFAGSALRNSRPHLGGRRLILDGQKIHPSVSLAEGLGTQYIPRAHVVPSDEKFWSHLERLKDEVPEPDGTFSGDFSKHWKEVDLYDLGANIVKRYTSHASAVETDDEQRTQLAMLGIQAKSGVFPSTFCCDVLL